MSRSIDRARAALDEIGADVALRADLTTDGDGATAVAAAASAFGGLDICVVNTGGGPPGPILSTDGADDAAYRSMLRPVLEISRAAAHHVTAGGYGRLVYLTSRSVVEASPDLALSSVFRSGVHAAARSLAIELAPRATVNVVVTGQFDTPALGRFESARAAAEGRTAGGGPARAHRGDPDGPARHRRRARRRRDVPLQRPRQLRHRHRLRVDGGAVRGF